MILYVSAKSKLFRKDGNGHKRTFYANKESRPKTTYVRHLRKSHMNNAHLRFIFDLSSILRFYKKSKLQQIKVVGMILPAETPNYYLE